MKIKTLVLLASFLLTTSAFAGLGPDFHCEAVLDDKTSVSVKLADIDFAKTISVKAGSKSCEFNIVLGSYSNRAASPTMIFDLSSKNCPNGKDIAFLEDGFIKIHVDEKHPQAFALVLIGHDSLTCKIKSFSKTKLESRIKTLFE